MWYDDLPNERLRTWPEAIEQMTLLVDFYPEALPKMAIMQEHALIILQGSNPEHAQITGATVEHKAVELYNTEMNIDHEVDRTIGMFLDRQLTIASDFVNNLRRTNPGFEMAAHTIVIEAFKFITNSEAGAPDLMNAYGCAEVFHEILENTVAYCLSLDLRLPDFVHDELNCGLTAQAALPVVQVMPVVRAQPFTPAANASAADALALAAIINAPIEEAPPANNALMAQLTREREARDALRRNRGNRNNPGYSPT